MMNREILTFFCWTLISASAGATLANYSTVAGTWLGFFGLLGLAAFLALIILFPKGQS